MHCVLTNNLSLLSAKHSKALSQLRHISFVKFSEVFHLGHSDIFKTSSRSVYISSSYGNCSNKKSICWINKTFSNLKSYHKCIGISTYPCIVSRREPKKLNLVRKMVWISDLDDPKVVLWNVELNLNVQLWITINLLLKIKIQSQIKKSQSYKNSNK